MRVRASRPTTDDRTPGRAAERPARAFRALTRTICGVALQLFDTAARQVREFRPARSGTASMYICGATVQGVPHIGHVRGALNYDVLRRWLVHSGLDVASWCATSPTSTTRSSPRPPRAGRPWWEWAATHERAFEDDLCRAGPACHRRVTPRATGHITQMIELIPTTDQLPVTPTPLKGNVYFSVSTFRQLRTAVRGQRLDEVQRARHRSEGKPTPATSRCGRRASRGNRRGPTPWGRGRPGWHLECSAMATHVSRLRSSTSTAAAWIWCCPTPRERTRPVDGRG